MYKFYHHFIKSSDDYFKRINLIALLGLVSISVAAFFLHTWADTVTAFIFWIIAAAVIQLNIQAEIDIKNK